MSQDPTDKVSNQTPKNQGVAYTASQATFRYTVCWLSLTYIPQHPRVSCGNFCEQAAELGLHSLV
jgi:hypothetical protein